MHSNSPPNLMLLADQAVPCQAAPCQTAPCQTAPCQTAAERAAERADHATVDELNRRVRRRQMFAAIVFILVAVGIQMVHSASLTSGPSRTASAFIGKHLCHVVLGGICGFLASRVSADLLCRHAGLLLRLLVILLVVVLIPGIGARVNGAQRWLRVSGFSFQPSELGRIVLPVMALAILQDLRERTGFRLITVPRTILPLIIVLPLVAVEPDLGATVFLGSGYLLALFIGGWPIRYFVVCLTVLLPVAGSLLILRPYQWQRIRGFAAAWQDLSLAPWQVRQSLLSLGSGGIFGTGVGGGWQKLSYLPEARTDFVFAVIGEELGLVGTCAICGLWIALFLTGRAALSHLPRDSFGWMLGTTLLLQLLLQAMANIAVVTALVPPKGVPHPFLSYGGTNLLVSLISAGLIIGLSQQDSMSPLPCTRGRGPG